MPHLASESGAWDPSDASPRTRSIERRERKLKKTYQGILRGIQEQMQDVDLGLWPGVGEIERTANLDQQPPQTLFYLAKVSDIPKVKEIYVEHRENGVVKHWAVLDDRDFEVMDEIYDIEIEVRERFPTADVRFRVTVSSESGPSIAPGATKIYESN